MYQLGTCTPGSLHSRVPASPAPHTPKLFAPQVPAPWHPCTPGSLLPRVLTPQVPAPENSCTPRTQDTQRLSQCGKVHIHSGCYFCFVRYLIRAFNHNLVTTSYSLQLCVSLSREGRGIPEVSQQLQGHQQFSCLTLDPVKQTSTIPPTGHPFEFKRHHI